MDFGKAKKHLSKKIPLFTTAKLQYRTIDGLRVGIQRAPARVAIPALIRLTKRFGDLIAGILSYGVPEGREEEDPKLAALLDVDWAKGDDIKNYLLAHALPQIIEGMQDAAREELYWFFEQLLPKCVVLFQPGECEQDELIETFNEGEDDEFRLEMVRGEPIAIETIDELDRSGAAASTLLALLYLAFEVNFLPTSGGLRIRGGSDRQNEPQQPSESTEPPESSELSLPEMSTPSSSSDETRRVGQSAPMSTSPG